MFIANGAGVVVAFGLIVISTVLILFFAFNSLVGETYENDYESYATAENYEAPRKSVWRK